MKYVKSWFCIPTKLYDNNYDNFFNRARLIWKYVCFDRFNILNEYSPYNIYPKFDPLPEFDLNDCSLENIILQRAEYYANNADNGIAVAWSGGVDSTGIVCALIEVGYPIEKINVICTKKSIEEYPLFYDFLKANRAKITINGQYDEHVTDIYKTLTEDHILLGWGADQLYHFYEVYNDRDYSNKPWKDCLRQLYFERGTSKYYEQDVEIYQQYTQLLNWNIYTFFDLCLMGNLCLKMSALRQFFQCQCVDAKTNAKTHLFYDSTRFTNWAYMNSHVTRSYFEANNNRLYKPEIKNIIYSVTKDKQYLYNKGKHPSWGQQYNKQGHVCHFMLTVYDEDGYHQYVHKISKLMPHHLTSSFCQNLFDHYMEPYLK
nr:MAG TPA: NAD synthase [Caudoviricetes sp.]